MKSVLITGANGFVGSHLTCFFSEKKIKVYALVQENTDYETINNLENVDIIAFDLGNIFEIKDKLPYDIDVLYHLAWAGVSTVMKNNESLQLKNVEYSLNVLKLAKDLNVKKVIYPGSVSEYAYSKNAVTGNDAPSPADFYSAAKVATHYICDIFARQKKINFNWVLIPSIYGPGREDNNLITYAIKAFLKGERPSFTKLEQQWDYIYVDDLMEALYYVGCAGKEHKVYPIGSGETHKLSYYITLIRDVINKNLSMGIGELPYKTDQIDNSVVDISSLRQDTGYSPKYTFEQGILKTISYFKEKYGEGL